MGDNHVTLLQSIASPLPPLSASDGNHCIASYSVRIAVNSMATMTPSDATTSSEVTTVADAVL